MTRFVLGEICARRRLGARCCSRRITEPNAASNLYPLTLGMENEFRFLSPENGILFVDGHRSCFTLLSRRRHDDGEMS